MTSRGLESGGGGGRKRRLRKTAIGIITHQQPNRKRAYVKKRGGLKSLKRWERKKKLSGKAPPFGWRGEDPRALRRKRGYGEKGTPGKKKNPTITGSFTHVRSRPREFRVENTKRRSSRYQKEGDRKKNISAPMGRRVLRKEEKTKKMELPAHTRNRIHSHHTHILREPLGIASLKKP